MVEYAEMTTWTLEEVQAQIPRVLPEGWRIERGDDLGHLWVRILKPQEDTWIEAWSNTHLDERTLLLDAFCWLWFRTQPALPKTSVWARRRGELSTRDVTRKVLASVADPEDLDPSEIRAVYEDARKKGR